MSGSVPISLAMDHASAFLFVANESSDDVSTYHIAENGGFTPVTCSPFRAGRMSCGTAVDPSGKFLYVANWGSNAHLRLSHCEINRELSPLT